VSDAGAEGAGGRPGRLEDRVAVVTGGASGIGEATVRLFAAEGARVVAADLQDERGRALAAELGPGVIYRHVDVTVEAEVQDLVEGAARDLGRLDVVFNNAGRVAAAGAIDEIDTEEFDALFALLVRGVFLGTKHAARILKRQGHGCILNTASVAGLQAGLGPHVYSAAKAAVVHLTRSVALELGPHGVRVSCLCPGGTLTPLVTGGDEAVGARVEATLRTAQPLPRAGLPEDMARAALWLASDEAEFVTGHALVVDGGMSAGSWRRPER